jgi:hypothetical protein
MLAVQVICIRAGVNIYVGTYTYKDRYEVLWKSLFQTNVLHSCPT